MPVWRKTTPIEECRVVQTGGDAGGSVGAGQTFNGVVAPTVAVAEPAAPRSFVVPVEVAVSGPPDGLPGGLRRPVPRARWRDRRRVLA